MSDSEVARESHDSETFEIIGDDRDVVPDKTVAEEDESEDLKENGVTDLNKENGDICNGETELNKQNGIAHDPLETPEGDQQNKEESQEEDNVVTSETEYEKEPEHEPEPEPEPEPNVEDKIENEVDIPVTPSQEKKEEEVKSIEEPVTDITPVEIKVTQVSEPAVEDHQPGNSENNRKSEVVEHNEEPKKISGSVITQIEDKENQTKEPDSDHRPKRGPSRRLDMSRFSKFEQQKTDDSTDSVPAWKKNRGSVNSSAVINKFTQQNQDASLLNECKVCSKRVYPMERLTADGAAYHKFCFKCTECKSTLRLGNFAMAKGRLYCKPHFKQLFKLKGNYDEAFTVGADRPGNFYRN